MICHMTNDLAHGPTVGAADSPEGLEAAADALIQSLGAKRGRKYVRFMIAALGSIPWVGGFLAASAGLSAEKDAEKISELQILWLEEHRRKARELSETLIEISERLDQFGDSIQKRIESPEFLALVRSGFRSWDSAATEDKRSMLKKLIMNAGAISLCPDDLVRLFITWIDQYHEAHFMVIREIYKNPGVTRGAIWDTLNAERPREDSAEADLFRFLIRDLSVGGVIRQARDTDMDGRFIRQSTRGRSRFPSSHVMESAFEDSKPYVLTELGTQFVHYVMEDVVPRIDSDTAQAGAENL